MKTSVFTLLPILLPLHGVALASPETLRLPLSGNGPSDAVEWDFQVTSGRRAGERAKIPVPSQWEQHGFGAYDYGIVPTKDKHKEDGIYQREFTVPGDWRGKRVRIVFEGSMTDTTVIVNGQQAGPLHQGGFYQFHYDITDKVKIGAVNMLEVRVSKDSANSTVEEAERGADYWVFGGIYRPVWLEARPTQSIEWSAVDARADGGIRAKVHLDGKGPADRVVARVMTTSGQVIGAPLQAPAGGEGPVELSGRVGGVKPWSAEEPNIYQIEISLMQGGTVVHRTIERTGFRTIETRPRQGVFVNGKRITVKGVNRHCFRPASGRALDPKDSVEDVRLIKSMNMNAVRCSHYPPDKAFLEACDELGLYVEDEICTWQKPVLDTPTAKRVIGQMIRRDVNHPSILWWANGNEGGWNTEADGDFALWDIQQRPVLHPWELFSGYQTKHYPEWNRLQKDLAGKDLVMPTEFLHGLFDGGMGAGLEDYWNAITSKPNGVGGFLWVLADEGISRTDRNGQIDTWGDNAPDGIVGPHHEKEASYLTVKDIYSPVQIGMKELPEGFSGRIAVSNKYDFRDLSTVRFSWRLEDQLASSASDHQPKEAISGELRGPSVIAGKSGELTISLPAKWHDFDVLQLKAVDRDGEEIWTWAWPIEKPTRADQLTKTAPETMAAAVHFSAQGTDKFLVSAPPREFMFEAATGRLMQAKNDGKAFAMSNGPRLVGADQGTDTGFSIAHRMLESGACRIEVRPGFAFEAFAWTIQPGGDLDLEYRYRCDQPTPFHGITFDMPEDEIKNLSWTGQGPERVWANRMRGTHFGTFERAFRKLKPGVDYDYPQCAGFYAGIYRSTVTTKSGSLQMQFYRNDAFLRIGTNDEGSHIAMNWPEGNISVMHAIPAMGNKFSKPKDLGPQSVPHPGGATVSGKVTFQFRK